MSQLVSGHYEYNTSCMIIFSKTNYAYSEDTLICPYKDLIVLTGGNANWVMQFTIL
jgi:hypothetical protein